MVRKITYSMIVPLSLVFTVPALADYTSIQHNLVDGLGDLQFDASTGQLTIHATSANLLTLNDPSPLSHPIRNTTIDLVTTFLQVGSDGSAEFAGGSITLTFELDNGGGFGAYEISGPIYYLYGPCQAGGNERQTDHERGLGGPHGEPAWIQRLA